MKKQTPTVSMATYHRMPIYLKSLYDLKKDGKEFVSSVALAELTLNNASVVKKDLSFVIKNEGKPKVGYSVEELVEDIENFLGYNNTKDAVIVGVGKLGQALLGYKGFAELGLNITAGFDVNESVIGKNISGKPILPMTELAGTIKRLNTKIAILTVPSDNAQVVADMLIDAGIRAVWNFTPTHLKIPDSVALKNENIASSLAVLSQQLKEILRKEVK